MGYKGEIPATHNGNVDVSLDVGPGVVYWIVVEPNSNNFSLKLRDGKDSSGEIILGIRRNQIATPQYIFDPPLSYERGLFVDVVGNIESFTIAFDHQE